MNSCQISVTRDILERYPVTRKFMNNNYNADQSRLFCGLYTRGGQRARLFRPAASCVIPKSFCPPLNSRALEPAPSSTQKCGLVSTGITRTIALLSQSQIKHQLYRPTSVLRMWKWKKCSKCHDAYMPIDIANIDTVVVKFTTLVTDHTNKTHNQLW